MIIIKWLYWDQMRTLLLQKEEEDVEEELGVVKVQEIQELEEDIIKLKFNRNF
jgi:hypothetical protein